MKYCEKCGNQLADEAAFCTKCGCAVGGRQDDKQQGGQVKNRVLGALLLTAGIAIIFITVIAAIIQYNG